VTATQPRPEPDVVELLARILRDGADLAGAECIGNPDPFDPPGPVEPLDDVEYRHRAAAAICARCPVLDRCTDWAQSQPADGMVRAGHLPITPRPPGRPRKDTAA